MPDRIGSKLHLVRFDKYNLNLLLFFKFFILPLFLVNGPEALYVNPGCLKCISGMNISPAEKERLYYFVNVIETDSFLVLTIASVIANWGTKLYQVKCPPSSTHKYWFFTITHCIFWWKHYISFLSLQLFCFYVLYFSTFRQ